MPGKTLIEKVQQPGPHKRPASFRAFTVDLDAIKPVIRIAHRSTIKRDMPQRIIFDHELVLVLSGRVVVEFVDHTVELKASDLLFLQPYEPHALSLVADLPCDHVAVHFDFAPGLPAYTQDPYRRRPYQVRFTQGLAISERITLNAHHPAVHGLMRVVEAHNGKHPWSSMEASLSLSGVLLELVRMNSSVQSSRTQTDRHAIDLERVVAFMRTRLMHSVTVEELADHAGLSVSHFNRLFTSWAGCSPMRYFQRLRLEASRRLLADENLSIKQVALACGFKDPYHFSKVFSRHDGLPPSAYREALLAGRLK